MNPTSEVMRVAHKEVTKVLVSSERLISQINVLADRANQGDRIAIDGIKRLADLTSPVREYLQALDLVAQSQAA